MSISIKTRQAYSVLDEFIRLLTIKEQNLHIIYNKLFYKLNASKSFLRHFYIKPNKLYV